MNFHESSKKISLLKLLFISVMWLPVTTIAREALPVAAVEGGPVVIAGEQGAPDRVDINAPDAYGLSYNPFVEFHVGEQGLELNNTAAEASIIFNDVKGNNISELNGRLIVTGKSADVVVSNHNGINCNGCGFVNSDHGVLTTGDPVFENGRLTGLQVNQGQINIHEQGLIMYDTSGISQGKIDLIAAGVTLNGFMHKMPQGSSPGKAFLEKIQIIAGKNRVKLQQDSDNRISRYDVERYGEAVSGENARIDVKDVGGMLARAIYLHGNDAGIGVNSNGAIWGVDKFVINTKGELTLNSHIIATNLIDISNADRVINRSGLEADKLIFRNIGHLHHGDDLRALKNPNERSLSASMGFQEIKAQDIEINVREFHNYAKITAGNRLELTANNVHNAGELTAGDLKIKADNLNHETYIYQADKGKVSKDVYQIDCIDDSCWQYKDTIDVPREKYRDIPATRALIMGKNQLSIDVKNDLTIKGAALESPAGDIKVNADNIKIVSTLLEEKTTSSQNHTDRWLFIPIKSSETKTVIVNQEIQKANLQAHNELTLNSKGSIMIQGASLQADRVDMISQGGNLDMRSLYLARLSIKDSSRAGFLGFGRTDITTETIEQTPVDTTLQSVQKLLLTAKNDIHLDNANAMFLLTHNDVTNGLNVVINAQKVIRANQPYALTKVVREK